MKKLLLLACLALPVPLFAQGGLPDKPYIYVEGKAEIEKAADMVTLRFDSVARNPDQAKANQEVQTKATKILALLKDKNIAQSDTIAADIKSEPEFEYDEPGHRKGKIIRYSVTRRFEVKVHNLEIFPKLVDELIGIPGTEFTEITGALKKQKEVEDEIWRSALVNAREQADKTAKAMGVTIDSVFAISPKPFAQIRGDIFGSDYAETTARSIVTGPPEYLLGPMTVSQSVHVIYLISPAK
ncbi:MAG TPA: SIMPL domain-containing protein [Chthoniobacterales bacterium]|nr:SIMPL domain-containing protein [Chthoniobacterales bacterium]